MLFAGMFVTPHKKQQLVHIIEVVLMVFSKRNMFALLKYIYLDHTCHSNFALETMSNIH